MNINNIPFGVTDWSSIDAEKHPGEQGYALWRTAKFDDIRLRIVEYSPGYMADRWCSKGRILFCLEGELHTELADPGTRYHVADNAQTHRSSTQTGAKLFIVD